MLGQVRLGQVRLGQVRLGQVRLGQHWLSGQARFGFVVKVVSWYNSNIGHIRILKPLNYSDFSGEWDVFQKEIMPKTFNKLCIAKPLIYQVIIKLSIDTFIKHVQIRKSLQVDSKNTQQLEPPCWMSLFLSKLRIENLKRQ